MRVDISIPDDVYADGERLVDQLNITRSELYADALREYVARHDDSAITAALDCVYADDDSARDPAILGASLDTLKRVEW
jgi:metal-responsive CopG/Arc/MetJ family transcriptional regulator